ncbi:hypothetical protein [Hugenholtzia roseola]|uniref:hypothetical protein n=1 Tax=Hugenholtzia roseola TaxID=1002 RepID=UPI00047A35EA|nr:hypothetical protein [Hugenholtzia roseola]
MKNLLTVSLRYQALFVPSFPATQAPCASLNADTSLLIANLARLGYGVTPQLLAALNQESDQMPAFQKEVLQVFRKVLGLEKNWTPLVKGWDTPTGESVTDHLLTFFSNIFGGKGTVLPCGHLIPPDTFPLERYNGCPFCGTPFEFGEIEHFGQNTKLKVLDLWREADVKEVLRDLLVSKTALDASQTDTLKLLLYAHNEKFWEGLKNEVLEQDDLDIKMKETQIVLIDFYIEQNKIEKTQKFFQSPTDILRYLWYKKTGFLQIIEPRTLVARQARNSRHIHKPLDNSQTAFTKAKESLKLKYNRSEGRRVAQWLNNLPLEADKICEQMHPKRGMWVRFIRALRLAEYGKKAGFEKLAAILDRFYRQDYEVWQGAVEYYRLRVDANRTFALLQKRPGLFARSLFANMLWFGRQATTEAFAKIIEQVPARLLFTLAMYAPLYFERGGKRTVKPLGGGNGKLVPNNALLNNYPDEELIEMVAAVEDLCLLAMQKRFEKAISAEAAQGLPTKRSIYIDPFLYKMPISIGERSQTIQDLPVALMGTRFALESDQVRLFMQWGEGLPAQHLDMDLSCHLAFEGKTHSEICYFGNLTAVGCKHSGDIRSIPEKIGTAEYIELDVAQLERAKVGYATFTCNAYSNGALSPNLVVGWMASQHQMAISEKTGVAYDPSCVQHQVRITQQMAKGLVFGVLDVKAREIVWLEMPFGGQVAHNLNINTVKTLLKKLKSRLSIGSILELKALAQDLELYPNPTYFEGEVEKQVDEIYTKEWGLNAAAVSQLLVD